MTTYGRTNAVTAGGGTPTPTPTQTKEVQATAFPTVVTPDAGYALSQATVTAPANLSAENIKKDVTIAGVTGNFEGTVTQGEKFSQLVDGSLTTLTADDLAGVTKIYYYKFYNSPSLTSVEIPNNITLIHMKAFSSCRNLTNVTFIGNGITTIEDAVFDSCQSLTSFIIPDSVTSLGGEVFSYCSSLTSVVIPSHLTTLGRGLFSGCSSLESITLPPNLTSIPQGLFSSCTKLAAITIPATVTKIGTYAFAYDTRLLNIEMLPTTPPTLESNSFTSMSDGAVIKVPKGSLEAYRTATNWVKWADYMVEATE